MLVDIKPFHKNIYSWTKRHRKDIHINATIILNFLKNNNIPHNLTYSTIKRFLYKYSNLSKHI